MSGKSKLILSKGVSEFFWEEVQHTRQKLGVKLCELSEYYIVQLLSDYASGQREAKLGEEALAILYKRAIEAPALERTQAFKELGDAALFISGFFAEFVERSMVGLDYYMAMGGTAYLNLADSFSSIEQGDTLSTLYEQLAVKFGEIVDIFQEINERSRENATNDRDLVVLYERWTQTRSERLRKILEEHGISPEKGPTGLFKN